MTTYYVRKTGSDANAGTSPGAAKLTIQAAINVATTAGDTIYVGSGVYRETCTLGSSGSAGNPISLIGDYTGAFTGDAKGVVRITGSADDIALTRANCIVASSKNYLTVRGFTMDLASGSMVSLTTATYVTISDCCFLSGATGSVGMVTSAGASQSNVAVSRCVFIGGATSISIQFTHSANVDNAGHTVSNCLFVGSTWGVNTSKVGGIVVNNSNFMSQNYAVIIFPSDLTAGQTITVNNCIFNGIFTVALFSVTTVGALVENYNTIYVSAAARTNTSVGANSVTRPPLFDTRWFFEMVNGGRLVTPFDLASYSTLVEYNSGTGAPSTDIRGASVVGTYREWGALEYDSTLSIAGGGASRVIGSPFIRGLGAV